MSKKVFPSLTCAVLGAGGYVGAELSLLLDKHPHVAALQLFHSGKDQQQAIAFADLHPHARTQLKSNVLPFDIAQLNADLVFLATPHEISAQLTPALLAQGKTVIDLSGAFRLKNSSAAKQHYGLLDSQLPLLADAVYGLPEFVAGIMRAARLISVPGCFVTAATLALKPLMDTQLIEKNSLIVIDAISGVSGAGKKVQHSSHYCEVSVAPYAVHNHRHQPEIEQNIGADVLFTAHLGPYSRGILASCHATTLPHVTDEHIKNALLKCYADQALIRILPTGQWPAIKNVAHTFYADIAYAFDAQRKRISIFTALDNLLKGAASQAVQCFNACNDLPLNSGLI